MAVNRTNAPLQKNSFYKYFEIYKDKFFKILGLNSIFFGVLLVLASLIYFIGYIVFGVLKVNASYTLPLIGIPAILLGPVIAAITKLCRDYVREVPGFFAEDFKNALKANFKQSIIVAAIQYVFGWLLYIAISFYYNISAEHATLRTIGLGVSFLGVIIYVFMSYYAYMMIVTLDLNVRQILKNSSIFVFIGMLKNVLLSVILGLWIALAVFFAMATIYSNNGIVYGFFFVFIMTLFFGFIFYTVSFFTYPQIKKYVLDPYYEAHPEQSSAAVKDKFNPSDDKNENGELPEFVYHNGKMVHRSAFEQEPLFTDREISDDKKK